AEWIAARNADVSRPGREHDRIQILRSKGIARKTRSGDKHCSITKDNGACIRGCELVHRGARRRKCQRSLYACCRSAGETGSDRVARVKTKRRSGFNKKIVSSCSAHG